MRNFQSFEYKSATYRATAPDMKLLRDSVHKLRTSLEQYLRRVPEFARSLEPLSSLPEPAPECARRMYRASQLTGVGPMAAVAGTFAQLSIEMTIAGAETGVGAGAASRISVAGNFDRTDFDRIDFDQTVAAVHDEYIVENGGDIFALIQEPLTVGLWVGPASPFSGIALQTGPEHSPFALCSSSSRMGHSLSLGNCDLVTVFAADASLADACATAACNRISSEETLQEAVEWGCAIEGIRGVLALKGQKMAMAGTLPELIRHKDPELSAKVTRHQLSSFED